MRPIHLILGSSLLLQVISCERKTPATADDKPSTEAAASADRKQPERPRKTSSARTGADSVDTPRAKFEAGATGSPAAKSPIFLVRPAGWPEAMPEALFEGEMDICGACVCIRDRERDTEYTPLWPAGYRLVPGQREFVIQDEAGNQIAETKAKRAEKLVLGGGETPSVDSAPASFLAQVKTCPPPYWFVSGPAQPFTGED